MRLLGSLRRSVGPCFGPSSEDAVLKLAWGVAAVSAAVVGSSDGVPSVLAGAWTGTCLGGAFVAVCVGLRLAIRLRARREARLGGMLDPGRAARSYLTASAVGVFAVLLQAWNPPEVAAVVSAASVVAVLTFLNRLGTSDHIALGVWSPASRRPSA